MKFFRMKLCKKLTLALLPVLFFLSVRSADTLQVISPSGKVNVKIWMEKQLTYSISYQNKTVMGPSRIDLIVENHPSLSASGIITSATKKEINEQIVSPFPEKRRIIKDNYNLLSLDLGGPYRVELRAYDDGVAYRISTLFEDTIVIENELAEFSFPPHSSVYYPLMGKRPDWDRFHTSFEENYLFKMMDSLNTADLAYLPVLAVPENGPKIGIAESDLYDYPGMFLAGTGSGALHGLFAGYPIAEQEMEEHNATKVIERAPYIAKTTGSRTYPWRVIILAENDKDLPDNDLVYRLASPPAFNDYSWVKPGKITDEWIIDINLFNVPFRAGLNTASYLYYIDFAKRFGFDRIMLDAGWSETHDLFSIHPDIDMDTIISYAREKGVGISLWTKSSTLEKQMERALKQFSDWGIGMIMVDFIDRNDQKAVNFFHRVAKACADHQIMVMFHGAFPTSGFNRTYPNDVAREGVLGSEFNIWSDRVTPGHDLLLPFTRMLSGGFDYEPGLLNNATKTGTRPVSGVVTSPGTRSHQLAMFVVYDSPTQIFSGNPSQGYMEPEFMELLGSIPTLWDETIITHAKVGEYIVTARNKGNDWYIGGMCDWNPVDLQISFDFLDTGVYEATICKDGINADRYAADYVIQNASVSKNDVIDVHLAPGGGFLIKLIKKVQ
jgi:alpha-glucosidase